MKLTNEQRLMVEDNMRLVYWVIREAGYVGDKQDAEQELMWELCKAAYRFDPTKGTKFSTYAMSCLKSKMKTLKAKRGLWSPMRQHKKGKPIFVGFEVTSLNRKVETPNDVVELMDVIPSGEISMEEMAIDRIDLERFIEALQRKDRRIIEMRMQGYTYREIANEIGDSEAYVCRRVKKLVEKLNS